LDTPSYTAVRTRRKELTDKVILNIFILS